MLKYLREEIRNLRPYQMLEGSWKVKLHANEGVQRDDGLNRYPVDGADALREKLGALHGTGPEQILVGNGSSELIELTMKAYLEAGETVLSLSPTFSMYERFALIHKGAYRAYPLEQMARLHVGNFLDFAEQIKPKLVILCNPNNPTGTFIPKEDICRIVQSVDAMVLLDEAYVEFSEHPQGLVSASFGGKLPNLIVLRTLSKAYCLAGIRLGYMIAASDTINCIHRVRSPYNVNSLSQRAALRALEEGLPEGSIEEIKKERHRVAQALQALGINPLPSQANFLFFRAEKHIFEHLLDQGILIRNFQGALSDYYRLTIGAATENNLVLKAIEEGRDAKGGD